MTIRSSKPSKRDESSVSARLGGELLDHRLRQLPPLRRQRDHALLGRAAVDGVERGRDDVDPQHHARAAAVRLVVHLAGAQRRRVAVVEEAQLELGAEHRGERPLLGHPRERVRNLGEDVEAHSRAGYSASAKPRATRTRRASRSMSSTHASTIGSSRPGRARARRSRGRARRRPRRRAAGRPPPRPSGRRAGRRSTRPARGRAARRAAPPASLRARPAGRA